MFSCSYKSEEIRDRLGIQSIDIIMQQMRIRWFGHNERTSADSWVSKCRSLVVNGSAGKGRPRKTWTQVVENDLKSLHLCKSLTQDRDGWSDAINKAPFYTR